MALDDRGFRIGAGSLCSGRPEDPSPVLEAIGHPGSSGFRVSLGPASTEEEVDRFLDVIPGLTQELREVDRVSREALERFDASPG
jgi:cysteine desulfurase